MGEVMESTAFLDFLASVDTRMQREQGFLKRVEAVFNAYEASFARLTPQFAPSVRWLVQVFDQADLEVCPLDAIPPEACVKQDGRTLSTGLHCYVRRAIKKAHANLDEAIKQQFGTIPAATADTSTRDTFMSMMQAVREVCGCVARL